MDSEGEITLIDVRDEIVKCFIQAQGSQEFGMSILKKQIKDAQVDFEDPSKEDLHIVMLRLANVASNFRNKEEIMENFHKIQKLINRCDR